MRCASRSPLRAAAPRKRQSPSIAGSGTATSACASGGQPEWARMAGGRAPAGGSSVAASRGWRRRRGSRERDACAFGLGLGEVGSWVGECVRMYCACSSEMVWMVEMNGSDLVQMVRLVGSPFLRLIGCKTNISMSRSDSARSRFTSKCVLSFFTHDFMCDSLL